MNRIAVFVLSDTRSGSTLLDQCLGGHPSIASLGEVHWLPAYARQDRSVYDPEHPLVCNCGQHILECPFWSHIEAVIGCPLADLQVRSAISQDSGSSAGRTWRRALLNVAVRAPNAYRVPFVLHALAGSGLPSDCIQLFDAVSEATGRDVCVDSSKSAIRFRAVYEKYAERTRAIVLTRDPRAVAYSKMKRGRPLPQAATSWRRKMQQIESLTTGIPARHVHLVKYEAFCRDPERELARICEFLGVEPSVAMLRRPTANLHNIGGSPSKFDKERIAISLDTSFETQLGATDMQKILRLVGNAAGRWGY